MKKFKWFVLFFSFYLWANQENIITFRENSINLLKELKRNEYLIRNSDFTNDPFLSIKPISFGYKDLLFYLNCEAENPQFLKDEVGHYNLIKKNLFIIKTEGLNQSTCYFKNRDQLILVETKSNSWPYINNQTFSISFWFKPLVSLKDQNLIEWTTFTESKIKKFNIVLNKNHVEVSFKSILKKQEEFIDLNITLSNVNFDWNHFFMSVDLLNKNITFYLNGKPIKLIQLPNNVQWDFDSLHTAPIQIGGKFLGYIDELMILKNSYQKPITYHKYPDYDLILNSGRINRRVKELVLPVISIPITIDNLKMILEFEKPEGTFLKIQYANFNNLNSHTIDWKDLPLQEEFSWDSSMLMKYIRFRVLMLQDVDGQKAPSIKKFLLEKKEFSDIPSIHQVRIIKEFSNNNQVCLEWQKVPEEIIEEKGGYNIHIGIKKFDYDLVISELYNNGIWQKINKKNTDFPLTEQEKELERIRPNYWKQYKNNHIRVILTKDQLYYHIEKQLEKNHLSIERMKLIFEDNITYYISVSSYIKEPQVRGNLSPPIIFNF